jgi:hypothetical protein
MQGEVYINPNIVFNFLLHPGRRHSATVDYSVTRKETPQHREVDLTKQELQALGLKLYYVDNTNINFQPRYIIFN